MNYPSIEKEDSEIYQLIKKEELRQKEGLELIPSENYTSKAVMESMGSILTNKYSEGYSRKRYYGGQEFIDQIETLAVERAKALFKVPHANVQPYSGSPANLAIYMATCQPGDTVLGLNLTDGGHLTHGWKVSATGIFYKPFGYHTKPDGRVDFDEVWKLAKEHKPKLIWCGATAYMYEIEYEKFAEIADSVGAFLAADIAHIAGLIVAGAHKSPAEFAHIITTTTHKTLRGPRGGMIMATAKGLAKDPELADRMDKAVFPGLQGGPHDHQTGAIAIALKEAATEEFKIYGHQIVKNAKALGQSLVKNGMKLVGGGTENHLLLMDLVPVFGPGGGIFGSEVLEVAGMTANKNTIPGEPGSPFYPSGVRLGSPALTTRGFKEKEMEKVGEWIAKALMEMKGYSLPEKKEERAAYISKFKKDITANETLKNIRAEVKELCKNFPVPGIE